MKKVKLIFGTVLGIAGLIGCLSEADNIASQATLFVFSLALLFIGGRLVSKSGILE